MLEEDYVMRSIKEMVRTILKLLFHIDTVSPSIDLIENEAMKETLQELLVHINAGDINEAENRLFAILEEGNTDDIKLALLFYSYLNDLDDDYLLKNNFSRDEVKDGIKTVMDMYGLESIADIYLL